jgi:hypothetical protein
MHDEAIYMAEMPGRLVVVVSIVYGDEVRGELNW